MCNTSDIEVTLVFAVCNFKAGKGFCCKHVAVLLYSNLSFLNREVKEVPYAQCSQKSKFGNKFNNLAQNKRLRLGGGSLEAELNPLCD